MVVRMPYISLLVTGLLHTILFNRALGMAVSPKEVDSEVFENLSYVRVDDVAITKHVETSVEKFMQMLEKSGEVKASVRWAKAFPTLAHGFASR